MIKKVSGQLIKLISGRWYTENIYSYSHHRNPKGNRWFDLPKNNCKLLFLEEYIYPDVYYETNNVSLKFLWNGKIIYCHYVENSTNVFKEIKNKKLSL